MKKIVVGLLTNRFGIVLAALNVCYFVSREAVRYTFEHIHGEKEVFGNIVLEKCFFSGDFFLTLTALHAAKLIELINLPALVLSLFSSKLINTAFSPGTCFFTKAKFDLAFILFFMTLQWLSIGWMAKIIARSIRKNQS